MTANTLQTNNTDWGFFGTISHHRDPEQAWPLALVAVARVTGFVLHAEVDADLAD